MTVGLPPEPALRKLFAKSFLNNLSKIFKGTMLIFIAVPFLFQNVYAKEKFPQFAERIFLFIQILNY